MNREQRRQTAHAAQLAASSVRLMGGTELEQRAAWVVGTCVAHGGTQQVSTAHIQERFRDRLGYSVGYGTVARVLSLLQRRGLLTWVKAHVPRWHGVRSPQERPRLYPRNRDGKGPRLPARVLVACGLLAALDRTGTTGVLRKASSPCAVQSLSSSNRVAHPRVAASPPFDLGNGSGEGSGGVSLAGIRELMGRL